MIHLDAPDDQVIRAAVPDDQGKRSPHPDELHAVVQWDVESSMSAAPSHRGEQGSRSTGRSGSLLGRR